MKTSSTLDEITALTLELTPDRQRLLRDTAMALVMMQRRCSTSLGQGAPTRSHDMESRQGSARGQLRVLDGGSEPAVDLDREVQR
jgi:hypothetical protein